MARREVTGKKPGVTADLVKGGKEDEVEDEAEDADPAEDEEPQREQDELPLPPPPRMAYTILQFCAAFGISEDFLLQAEAAGPRPAHR